MPWYDVMWYDMIWYDMIWYDSMWYDLRSAVWCTLPSHRARTTCDIDTVHAHSNLQVVSFYAHVFAHAHAFQKAAVSVWAAGCGHATPLRATAPKRAFADFGAGSGVAITGAADTDAPVSPWVPSGSGQSSCGRRLMPTPVSTYYYYACYSWHIFTSAYASAYARMCLRMRVLYLRESIPGFDPRIVYTFVLGFLVPALCPRSVSCEDPFTLRLLTLPGENFMDRGANNESRQLWWWWWWWWWWRRRRWRWRWRGRGRGWGRGRWHVDDDGYDIIIIINIISILVIIILLLVSLLIICVYIYIYIHHYYYY